eukprot:TRINITY_DN17266_c0_g1_i1.p1 TRINITY_DN17266_c0_g1~~TRINITY_DN17266_c0_g1_i1.p1  ORF type:complete len:326 (-),score=76.15 TRINITY_DN17266_c0_g1_i1:62-1039(-)
MGAEDATTPETPQKEVSSTKTPPSKKGLEVDDPDKADVENKEVDTNAVNTNVTTPEDSKSRLCPRPYLEIETGDDEEDTQSPDYTERKISLDLTPLSCKSTDSSAEYHQPNQTIIILDWDDTICPSTTCMRTHGLSVLGAPPEPALQEQLAELAQEAKLLIEACREIAEKVVVVTNAEEGWVDLSCKAWLPDLLDTIEKCEVASARSTWEPQGVTSPAGWKARTFEDVIEKFYSRYEHQSWKNIISVGDAPHEREALARVVRWAPGGHGKRCRSKSVKFVLRPSVDQLCRELQMLRDSIKEIVWHDDDLDLHFSAESLADPPSAH